MRDDGRSTPCARPARRYAEGMVRRSREFVCASLVHRGLGTTVVLLGAVPLVAWLSARVLGYFVAAPWHLALGAVGAATVLRGLFLPTRWLVGDDGLYLRWLWFRRFVSYGRMLRIDYEKLGIATRTFASFIVITLKGGRVLRLPVRMPHNAPEGDAALSRVGLALSTRHAFEKLAAHAVHTTPTSQDYRFADARALGAPDNHRSVAAPYADLLAAMRSPASTPPRRAFAAVALSRTGHTEALRAVLNTSAHPELQTLLAALLDEDLGRAASAWTTLGGRAG